MEKLRVNSIDINGIGPIRHLHLYLNNGFNIICGANGIGKTTILDCIAQSFTVNDWKVRCTAGCENGNWKLGYAYGSEVERFFEHNTAKKYLNESDSSGWGLYQIATNMLVFKVNRIMSYKAVDSINKDPKFSEGHFGKKVSEGADYAQIKQWFINRHLWSAHPNELDEAQRSNLERAKQCFSDVNAEFKFKKIDPTNNDILIDTLQGAIELEQLSAGYIAMMIVLLGIIKEIEYRFKDPTIKVEDFNGVVILDEMDVHLHPTMQARMYLALKALLPNAQIITSTHSPHIIQVAKPAEIIPLVRDGVDVRINPLVNQEYGCQGWTVEEILKDVMGMQESRTEEYRNLMAQFNHGIQIENANDVKNAFEKLDRMLHPESVVREVIKIQKIGLCND